MNNKLKINSKEKIILSFIDDLLKEVEEIEPWNTSEKAMKQAFIGILNDHKEKYESKRGESK